MTYKVQIEVTSPVQDPLTGEVVYQPGTRFDEGAKELDGLPAHMLRPVFTDEADDKSAEKPDDKPAPAASKPAASSKSG